MVQFVNIRSLGNRPLGGLSIEEYLTNIGDVDYEPSLIVDSWSYLYSYSQLVNWNKDNDYDIVKVTSLERGYLIDRYILIVSDGKAISLARRSVSSTHGGIENSREKYPSTVYIENLAYVQGADRLLTAIRQPRVFPLKARADMWAYKQYSGDIFTPIVFRMKDVNSPDILRTDTTRTHMGWIDKISLQGWYPSSVIRTLQVDAPEHCGWTIEGCFIEEVYKTIHSTESRDISEETIPSIGRVVAYAVSESAFADYRAILDLERLENDGSPSISLFEYYDPCKGEIIDLHDSSETTRDLNTRDVWNECNLVLTIYDRCRLYMDLDLYMSMTVYRQLNDFIYIVFTKKNDLGCDYVIMDFAKYLLVHYGFVDIPSKVLQASNDIRQG